MVFMRSLLRLPTLASRILLAGLGLATVAVAGCYNPDFSNGSVGCGPNGDCPTGLTCNAADQRCYTSGSVLPGPFVTILTPTAGATTDPTVTVTFSSTTSGAAF